MVRILQERTGMDGVALGFALADEVEELGCHDGAGVRDLLSATLGDNISSAIWSLDAFVARGRPPSLDFLNLSIIKRILGLSSLLRFGQQLEGVGSWDR